MPELRIKDVRMPELRLPEMSRQDISKALGEVRRDIADASRDFADASREIDLSKVDLSKVEFPKVDISRKDVSKAFDSAAEAVGVRKSRSPIPFVIAGIVTLGLVAWALLSSPRPRASAPRRRRPVSASTSSGWAKTPDIDEPRAFDAAVAVPVEPSAYSDSIGSNEQPIRPAAQRPAGRPRFTARDEVARA